MCIGLERLRTCAEFNSNSSPGGRLACYGDIRVGNSKVELTEISPPTLNTQVLGPLACTQARRLPVPESLVLVTSYTVPPRPPTVFAPKPSAPGKAGTADWAKELGSGVKKVKCGYKNRYDN